MVMSTEVEHWDAFVSHAWEDKNGLVRPLVEALGRLGVSLWYDEVSLRLGDSLVGSVDCGIAKSRNGIVVVSPAFLQKKWPEAELQALMSRRIEDKLKLLPVWHNVARREVAAASPMLADLWALRTDGLNAQDIALALLAEIRPDLYQLKGRSQLERLATGRAFEELEEELSTLREKVSDLLCPSCDAPVSERMFSNDYSDPTQVDVEVFECGYVRGGHHPQTCPHDPAFPALDDYELRCKPVDADNWICRAAPRSAAAERHIITGTHGPTEKEAKDRLIENYNRSAPPNKRVELKS